LARIEKFLYYANFEHTGPQGLINEQALEAMATFEPPTDAEIPGQKPDTAYYPAMQSLHYPLDHLRPKDEIRSRVTSRSIRTAAKESVGKTIERRGGTAPATEELLELAEASEAALSEQDDAAASQGDFELPSHPQPLELQEGESLSAEPSSDDDLAAAAVQGTEDGSAAARKSVVGVVQTLLDPDSPSPGDDGSGAQPLPGNIPNGGHGSSGHEGAGPDMGPPASLDPNQGAIPGSPTAAPS